MSISLERVRRTRRLRAAAAATALAVVALGGIAALPASAAAPRAAAPAPGGQTKVGDETWLGQIHRQGKSYAYVGRACPEQAEICYDIVANYRIVALNPAAARAVRRLAGSQARLHGHLGPGPHGTNTQNGILYVTRAERPKPSPAKTVRADEASNGQTVSLAPGDHLEVVLHSTYWAFDDPSDPAVISADGTPVVAGGGTKCGPPGSGCGTVTARFTAQHAGHAVVSAHRTTCGEAMRCSPAQSKWAVKVDVAG